MRRVLVTGWPSFLHGEATAGDVLAMEAVAGELRSRAAVDLAWSPRFRPGELSLEDAEPSRYDALVFACGPLYGEQVTDLHRRFARCRRVAVGVSVIDPDDPAVTGFDVVLPRDGTGGSYGPRGDLSAGTRSAAVPVVGVVLAPGQAEYGERRCHERVRDRLTGWLAAHDCAPVPLDTRLDREDWRMCTTPAQYESIVRRLDLVVTTRLHGLVLALKNGVPVLAADPVAGGAKVSAQAHVWDWPVLTCSADPEPGRREPPPVGGTRETDARRDTGMRETGGPLQEARLRELWDWCLSAEARDAARRRAATPPAPISGLVDALG